MTLFDIPFDSRHNLLPFDGEVFYHGRIVNADQAWKFYEKLLKEINWEHDKFVMYGKEITTRRKVGWYGDQPFPYTYSGVTKKALEWTKVLKELKDLVEKSSGVTFNSCLLNLYHNGREGMSWHSDDEKDLKRFGTIASLSLGSERKFVFKHKVDRVKVELLLEHGSLLVMKGRTQEYWKHRLPPDTAIQSPRINLTFRIIDTSAG